MSDFDFIAGDYVREIYRSKLASDEIDQQKQIQEAYLERTRIATQNMYNYWNTIAGYLRLIQDDFDEIETRMAEIQDSIFVFKDLGTNCDKGIYTVNNEDGASRALSIMSLKDTGQLEKYREYLDDPNYTDDADFWSIIDGSQ